MSSRSRSSRVRSRDSFDDGSDVADRDVDALAAVVEGQRQIVMNDVRARRDEEKYGR